MSSFVATMLAASLALENAMVTDSRIASSDTLSLLFTAISYYAWTKYYFQGKRVKWFMLLSVSLGLSLSCNWFFALAIILFVMLYSLADLWNDFCTQVPMTTILRKSLKMFMGMSL